MNLDCGGEWISSYLDGELATDEVTRAEAHLATCVACQARVQQFRRLNRSVAALVPEPPPDLAQLVMSALPATPAAAPRRAPAYLALGTWTTIIVALASIGFLTWILSGLGWAWKVITRLLTIVWSAGIWHLLTPTGLLRGAGVLLLCGLLVGLAVYGTRLLDRTREVAH